MNLATRWGIFAITLFATVVIGMEAQAYYDPQQGRFITRDPSGFHGSQWNLYEYVNGRTTRSVDPSGRQRKELTDAPNWLHRTAGTLVPDAGGHVKLASGDEGEVRVFVNAAWQQRSPRVVRTAPPDYIQFELSLTSSHCSVAQDCHWLQFARLDEYDDNDKPLGGSWRTRHQFLRRGEWYIDTPRSREKSPYYDTYGASHVSLQELSIFDRPVHGALGIGARIGVFSFRTFLVCHDEILWRIAWQYACLDSGGLTLDCGYQNVVGGPARHLDQEFNVPTWRAGYGTRRGEVLNDPYDVPNPLQL